MLRVWGGGYYEDERFYDLCDRYGILVWQDFMFSCSIYPLDDEEFLANVKSEVEDNLRRIRHRACLALWCGNNEMDWGWESWGWSKLDGEDMIVEYLESSPSLRQYLSLLEHRQVHPEWETLRAAYKTFFYKTLPGWVSELDPHTSYWPSSPSSNTPFVDSNGVAMGNTHNWDVWHGGQPFEGYREHPSRFVSEFGFQSLPAIKTICSYAEEADWNMTSYIMEHHQRNEAGNRKIMTYLGDHFRFPKDFPSLVYLTQIQQAEAMRIGVEYWRRNRVCTSGTLYWQLNDCWPVASWSSLDYYGRWKALHYATRRFFAPMLLSIEDRGTRIEVHVTSDLTEIWEGKLDWRLETLRGEVLSGGVAPVIAPPLSNHPMLSMDFRERISDQESRELIFTCELRQDDEILATRIATFAPDKHLALEDPEIWVDSMIMGDNLVFKLTAGSLARFVWLEMEGVDLVFSDNYFDLPANREITVAALIPEGWGLERAQTALKVRSLYDSF
jgi:beta-mannosidase